MNVILLGSPGSGKGTQGAILAQKRGIPRIATGDLLRSAVGEGSPLGKRAQKFMDLGLLVPDDIILGLILEVLASPKAEGGVIMDGFPRTIAQAEVVDGALTTNGSQVDSVLRFEVPDDEVIRRLLARAKKEERSDDTQETIAQRLAVYRQETEPLIAFYRKRDILIDIDATGAIEEIAQRVDKALPA